MLLDRNRLHYKIAWSGSTKTHLRNDKHGGSFVVKIVSFSWLLVLCCIDYWILVLLEEKYKN